MRKLLYILLLLIPQWVVSQSTIPFELVNDKVIIDVKVNGQLYKFALDFQHDNVISQKVVEEKKLQITANGWYPSEVGDSVISNGVLVNELEVGALKFLQKSFTAVDLNHIQESDSTQIDGFIGYSLFKNYTLEINFPEKHLKLRSSGYLPTGSAFRLELAFNNNGSLSLPAIVHQQKCTVAVDFSSGEKLLLRKKFYNSNIKNTDLSEEKNLVSIGLFDNLYGNEVMIKHFRLGDIHLKNFKAYVLQEKPVYMDSPSICGGVGTEIFQDRIIYFDFQRESLWINK